MASLTGPLISATFTKSREKDLKVKLVAEKSQKKFTKNCDSSVGSLNSLIRMPCHCNRSKRNMLNSYE